MGFLIHTKILIKIMGPVILNKKIYPFDKNLIVISNKDYYNNWVFGRWDA